MRAGEASGDLEARFWTAILKPSSRPMRKERELCMPDNPKKIEEKLKRMLPAWQTLAPYKSFGGVTMGEFEAAVASSLAARQRVRDLENQLAEAKADRGTADEVSLRKAQLVVKGVVADPTEGPDSPLYEAFGYTSKRKKPSYR
jgi:hypothetical protein